MIINYNCTTSVSPKTGKVVSRIGGQWISRSTTHVVTDETHFTLNRNVNSQNNRYCVLQVSMHFMKFLFMTLKLKSSMQRVC